MSATIAECFLMDVGQGSCNIILLGKGRGIVIDCGPSAARAPLQLLKRHVTCVDALIVSHNHRDHDGGAARILQAYPKAVKQLYFLEDGPAESIRTFALAKAELARGNLISEPRRIEAKAAEQLLFPLAEEDERTWPNLQLVVLYPSMMDTLDAQEEPTPQRRSNRTSAVLALICGRRRAVLPGDTSIEGWEAIHRRHPKLIECDVLALPHHGGFITIKNPGESPADFLRRAASDYARLFQQIIRPDVVVASVGSSNAHKHPMRISIDAARAAGSSVMCTQITPRCADDLERLKPGVISSPAPSRSSINSFPNAKGVSRDIGCAGTVVLRVSPNGIRVQNLAEHQDAVDKLAQLPGCHPLCRARQARDLKQGAARKLA